MKELLESLNPSKAADIDWLTGKFLKEGAPYLSSPSHSCVTYQSPSTFPEKCKITKLKPLFNKLKLIYSFEWVSMKVIIKTTMYQWTFKSKKKKKIPQSDNGLSLFFLNKKEAENIFN